ncbi:hypothetical protein D9613_001543 [Agrocybe pediades]|uniref:Protein kinase domain-containing protein n=1 Tax=Agrocybe pediades TaxID=84607 RepID=A0A8H4VUD3_9AGAR|nr:hypothetical protein D9613_001543 [Agrocybe pediades]
MLDFSFHPDTTQTEKFADLEPQDTPVTFYDRHISSNLVCRQVSAFPSMVQSLSKICDKALARYHREGHQFSLTGYPKVHRFARYPMAYGKAPTIGDYFGTYVGNPASTYASRFYFLPESWEPVFFFQRDYPDNDLCDFFAEYTLGSGSGDVDFPEGCGILPATVTQVGDLYDRFPTVALWHLYPMTPSGKSILKNMQSQHTFVWEYARTIGHRNVSLKPSPPDASNGILYHCKQMEVGRRRRAQAIRNRSCVVPSEGNIARKPSSVVNVHRQATRTVRRRTRVNQFIQHAWARAVDTDSTFIIFNCGLYERIGIRHRESQTLYISPLIEPINSRNPSYGKLHVGLHVAIIQDLLQRSECQKSSGHSKKRSAGHLDNLEPPKKRRRKEEFAPPQDVDYVKVKREMNKRDSKTKFRSTEYIDLTLLEPIGEGAVGVVHPAKLSLALADGQVLKHRVIVKVAFSVEQREKLRHEYDVYSHLASIGHVQGIVEVHGLFEDPDSSALALVMEDGGQSLSLLNELEVDRGNKVTGDDRISCLEALKALHKAGVRHRDIRPQSILFDAQRRVKIIDFDSATFNPAEMWQGKLDNEIKRLEEVLDGDYVDGLWIS